MSKAVSDVVWLARAKGSYLENGFMVSSTGPEKVEQDFSKNEYAQTNKLQLDYLGDDYSLMNLVERILEPGECKKVRITIEEI